MKLEPLQGRRVSCVPQACNYPLHCDLCGREIPPEWPYYDLHADEGFGTACDAHTLEEIEDWAANG